MNYLSSIASGLQNGWGSVCGGVGKGWHAIGEGVGYVGGGISCVGGALYNGGARFVQHGDGRLGSLEPAARFVLLSGGIATGVAAVREAHKIRKVANPTDRMMTITRAGILGLVSATEMTLAFVMPHWGAVNQANPI